MPDDCKPRVQQMYKVGYGSNLWGILSEDSLDKYSWLPGCIEHIGERTIYEIPCGSGEYSEVPKGMG